MEAKDHTLNCYMKNILGGVGGWVIGPFDPPLTSTLTPILRYASILKPDVTCHILTILPIMHSVFLTGLG